MVGCLHALGLCRPKRRGKEARGEENRPQEPATEGSKDTLADPEKPPLKEEAVDEQAHNRVNANSVCSAYSVSLVRCHTS